MSAKGVASCSSAALFRGSRDKDWKLKLTSVVGFRWAVSVRVALPGKRSDDDRRDGLGSSQGLVHLVGLEVSLGDGRSEGGVGGDKVDEEEGRRSESAVDDGERVSAGEGERLRSGDEVSSSVGDSRNGGAAQGIGVAEDEKEADEVSFEVDDGRELCATHVSMIG